MTGQGVITAVIQLILAVGGSTVVIQMLTLRQNRRKIAGDASTAEANAASALSGAALEMVESARLGEKNIREEYAAHKAECVPEIKGLKTKVSGLEDANVVLHRRNDDLTAFIENSGLTPPLTRRRAYDPEIQDEQRHYER